MSNVLENIASFSDANTMVFFQIWLIIERVVILLSKLSPIPKFWDIGEF